jgi:hypothetical protein
MRVLNVFARGLDHPVVRGLVVGLLATAAASGGAAQEKFAFRGLSRDTTLEDLRTRYPESSISGRHLHVSEKDSHDHIYGISIPESDPAAPLILLFEKRGPRAATYPRCETVLGSLEKQYGEPARVQEFDEERARNRRFIWWRGGEALSLLCFRLGRPHFSAAELTISLREKP